MRCLVLGLVILSGAAVAAAPPAKRQPAPSYAPAAAGSPAGPICRRTDVVPAGENKAPAARKLGELPPGNLELAVVRKGDECIEPVIVRYGVGNAPAKPRPRTRSGH